jgi:hypothetical protein
MKEARDADACTEGQHGSPSHKPPSLNKERKFWYKIHP